MLGQRCLNPACERGALSKGPRCGRCRAWWYRHRTEHPGGVLWQPRPVRPTHCLDRDCEVCMEAEAAYQAVSRCLNPACPMPRAARTRRCLACADYWAAHHQERPAWLARPQEVVYPRLPCQVLGCGRPARARGWCASHYVIWRRGRALPVRCREGACPQAPAVRGWCPAHYTAQWRARRAAEVGA
jgi:hypothetical protein